MYVVQHKYPKGSNTAVVICQTDPYVSMNVELRGDYMETSDDELVQLALEEFYQITYTNRAERESITELKNALDTANKQREEAIKTLNDTQLAMIEVTEQHYSLEEKVDLILKHLGLEVTEDDTDEDTTNNGDTENE